MIRDRREKTNLSIWIGVLYMYKVQRRSWMYLGEQQPLFQLISRFVSQILNFARFLSHLVCSCYRIAININAVECNAKQLQNTQFSLNQISPLHHIFLPLDSACILWSIGFHITLKGMGLNQFELAWMACEGSITHWFSQFLNALLLWFQAFI